MRELDFINAQSPAPDVAITAYVDLYAHDLPDRAVQAIKAVTRLGNKKLSAALAAMAADAGVADGGPMNSKRQMQRRCTSSETMYQGRRQGCAR
jgi:hypothetical protein